MALIGNLVVNLVAKTGLFGKNMRKARKSIKNLGKTAAFIGRGIGKSFRLMGSASLKLFNMIKKVAKVMAVVFVGAITVAIRSAAKFRQELALVSTMLSEQAMPRLKEFASGITDLSKKVGQSTDTLSKALFDILSASIAPAKAMNLLADGAKAAVAGQTSVKDATSALITVMKAYQIPVEDATMVSDKLFATFKRGRFFFGDLAKSIGRAAASAAIAGLSLDEFLASIASITRINPDMEQAMTGISQVVTAFIKPTKEATIAAEEEGLALTSITLRTEGLIGALQKLNKLSVDTTAKIFGNKRAFRSVAAILQDLEGFYFDVGLIGQRSAGLTEEAYSKMADTVSFKMNQFKQTVVAAFVALGEPLLGPFSELLGVAMDDFDSLDDVIRDNADQIEDWGFRFVDAFVGAKDAVFSFLNTLRTDFPVAAKFAFDSMIPILESTLFAMVNLAVIGGKAIMLGLKRGLLGGVSRGEVIGEIARRFTKETGLGTGFFAGESALRKFDAFEKAQDHEAIRKQLNAEAVANLISESATDLGLIKNSFTNTFDAIGENFRAKQQEGFFGGVPPVPFRGEGGFVQGGREAILQFIAERLEGIENNTSPAGIQ